ncbi:trypsin-like peptidase domain-containing protein [Acholeplasma equirhinis]|uniref:trypsin-like peptidase domain-containing protein n=1 Tax=Acholeplasma equirhinis TaxID=555393 RepID=UPI00197AFFA2|nr:trypsin-like peptidase domain-containing protein [Acholeplasma equirhinis]MBN3490165.1 trypsin-like peptidase domain-containing protein [Acholeplasma equirhinis]
MKKILLIFNLLLLSVLSGCIHNLNEIIDHTEDHVILTYSVQFYVENSVYYEYNEKFNSYVKVPKNPEKLYYIFDGWFDSLGSKLDPKKSYNSNIKFYAKFSFDYVLANNTIQTKIISSNVKINTYVYDLGFLGWSHINQGYGSGSGVIIDLFQDYFIVLTNAHVTYNHGRSHIIIDVIDYKGNAYKAYKMEDSELLEYDLSLIYFKKTSISYNIIQIAQDNPNIGEIAISIGQPGGQNNSVTYGTIMKYTKINEYKEGSSFEPPEFNVMQHNAPTAPGSSGGVILNDKLMLIGLHFAGSTDSFGNFAFGYAIPVGKIREYLKLFNFIPE